MAGVMLLFFVDFHQAQTNLVLNGGFETGHLSSAKQLVLDFLTVSIPSTSAQNGSSVTKMQEFQRYF
jgi:hypothetical protein